MQKSRKFRKLLSLTLCLMMVLGNVAVGGGGLSELLDNFAVKANAEETGYEADDIIELGSYPQSEITDITGLTENVDYAILVEDTETDGVRSIINKYYAYEPIEWKVLDAETGLCVCNCLLDTMNFDSNSNDYADSDIRAWLTGTFFSNYFTDAEKSTMLEKNIVTYAHSDDGTGETIVSTLNDKIFLLSLQEVSDTDYFADDYARACSCTDYSGSKSSSDYWWLRTPGMDDDLAATVFWDGPVDDAGCYTSDYEIGYIRPALYLNLESELFKSEITSDMVEDIPDCKYTGEEFKPAATVKDGEKTLTENTDYTVAYSDNINAGTATVTVTGIEKYKGTAVKTFTINKRSVTLTSGSDTKTYDGIPLTNGNVAVSGDGFVGDEGATYDFTGSQTNAGVSDNTFTYRLNEGTDESNYDITLEFGKLTVDAKAITEEMISGVYNASYTGKPIVWEIVVKDGDKTLTENADYTVSYKDNTNAGPDASVTITGIGNYGSTVTEKFIISPAAQSAPTGIISTDETKCSASDGTISGLSTDMEIAFERGDYTSCAGETIKGLAPGFYFVRYAGNANYAASDFVQVVIKEGNCYGGTATCINKAVCDGCHNEYGELGDHEWNDSYTVDKEPTLTEAGSESIHCKHCEAVKDSRSIISASEEFEIERANVLGTLDTICKEHTSRWSQKIIAEATESIESYVYDENKSLNENVQSITAIKDDAADKVIARHNFIYGCPFLRFIANILEPIFSLFNRLF